MHHLVFLQAINKKTPVTDTSDAMLNKINPIPHYVIVQRIRKQTLNLQKYQNGLKFDVRDAMNAFTKGVQHFLIYVIFEVKFNINKRNYFFSCYVQTLSLYLNHETLFHQSSHSNNTTEIALCMSNDFSFYFYLFIYFV